jgi:myo-inositol-1-phosphate synthase
LKPDQTHPGITKTNGNNSIDVVYQNRFTLYDPETNTPKAVIQEKSIKTDTRVPKLGVMLVGLGGNNGSTFTAGVLANRQGLTWATKNGEVKANMFGSFT